MIDLQLINPIRYISNLEELQMYRCSICFQFKLEMRRCSGPCKKYICILCIKNYEQNIQNLCCFCNQDLLFQGASFPQLIFSCPSNSNQCKVELRSAKQFMAHSSKCLLVDKELRKQFQYKISYTCKCGHPLKFRGRDECYECDLKQGARSRCQKCQIQFCTMCRLVSCNKQVCMNGHQLKKKKQCYAICDLCRLSISMLNSLKGYSDSRCDFDICAYCYQKLDESNLRQKFQQKIKPQFNGEDQSEIDSQREW